MATATRVVIFEDDYLLAEALSDSLTRLGCQVVHCCGILSEALLVVDAADFDMAVVDLDLHGLDASPILDRLVDRNIPALLATGSSEGHIRERFVQIPRLTKPYDQKQLKKAIRQMQTSASQRVA